MANVCIMRGECVSLFDVRGKCCAVLISVCVVGEPVWDIVMIFIALHSFDVFVLFSVLRRFTIFVIYFLFYFFGYLLENFDMVPCARGRE